MMCKKIFLFMLLFILGVSAQLEAQVTQPQDDFIPGIYGSGMANYYYARPGDFTIFVSVWGAIGRSGRYEVPIGTDVGQLISLAGGPGADVRGMVGADTWARRTAGKTIVRLSRLSGGGREVIMELDIERLLQLKEQTVPLQDGDILMIDQVRRFNIWDVFAIVSTSASMVLLMDRIFTIF